MSNKADAGFGYGETRPKLIVNDDTDGTAFEAAATAMMHDMPTASSMQIDISNTPILPGNTYIGTLNKQGDGSLASIFAISHSGDIVVKTRSYSGWGPWRRVAIAEPPTWYNLPLANGFIASGSSAYNQYCKDQFGRVTVRLKCSTPDNSDIANGAIIATLPEGYRPPTSFTARNHVVYDDIRGKLSYISVDANGTIRGYGYDHSGFSGATAEISFCI